MTTTTRADRVAEARRLRAEGVPVGTIAAKIGVGRATVMRWTDEGSAERDRVAARTRKEGYRGVCATCGASTNGANGPSRAPVQCGACRWQQQRDEAVWTRDRLIVEAFRWKRLVGRFPISSDWHTTCGGRPQPGRLAATLEFRALTGPWPVPSMVDYRFGSWRAFMRAVGGDAVGRGGRGVLRGQREREIRDAIERLQRQTDERSRA